MPEKKRKEDIELFRERIKDSYKPLSAELYDKYNVQRGLRHKDGTGVMAGLTAM